MTTITARIEQCQAQIAEAAKQARRDTHSVHLLAVSKGQPETAIREAYASGLRDFGENYWQEAHAKQQALSDLNATWHFIGKLQKNKIKSIAAHFDWVHSVTRVEELLAFEKHRPEALGALQVCIEVHLPGALGASGCSLALLPALFEQALKAQHLSLRGLMVIASPSLNEAEQLALFKAAASTLSELNARFKTHCDTLSMGMSGDYVPAIKAGSTWVRLGRNLFGNRNKM